MKKLAALFTASAQEFKKVRTICMCGVFAALAIVLSYVTSIQISEHLKVGFSGLPNEFVDFMFGPAVGSIFAAALDILKFLLKPTGGFIPGLTLNAFLAGLIYGVFLYRKPISFWRILAAKLTVGLVINVVLGTYWLSGYYGWPYWSRLPDRILSNVIAWPVDTVLLYVLLKAFERAGLFRTAGIVGPGKKRQDAGTPGPEKKG